MSPNIEPATNSKIDTPTRQSLPKAQKKSVSWSPSPMLVTTNEYSILNTDCCWYQRHEIMDIKKENRITSQIVKQEDMGQLDVGSLTKYSLCSRGLETMIDETRRRTRTLRKREAVKIVLVEQRDQQGQGVCSPYFIAELYQELSCPAQHEAHMIGLQDQRAAASIHCEAHNNAKAKKSMANSTVFTRLSAVRMFQRATHSRKVVPLGAEKKRGVIRGRN